jgi:hypothetical protein
MMSDLNPLFANQENQVAREPVIAGRALPRSTQRNTQPAPASQPAKARRVVSQVSVEL